ncbi:hypothetical protein [Desulfosarcina sp.]|uniref:hypothetical protein n=1 Tax=Desulfosarcina sp. TaxID=2027861 RepID=UPI003970EDA9
MILERLRQALWQVPLLIIIAGLVASGTNQWRSGGIALIHRFGVKSTPTCIVTQPGKEMTTYRGSGGIPAGIDPLLAGLPPEGSNN